MITVIAIFYIFFMLSFLPLSSARVFFSHLLCSLPTNKHDDNAVASLTLYNFNNYMLYYNLLYLVCISFLFYYYYYCFVHFYSLANNKFSNRMSFSCFQLIVRMVVNFYCLIKLPAQVLKWAKVVSLILNGYDATNRCYRTKHDAAFFSPYLFQFNMYNQI